MEYYKLSIEHSLDEVETDVLVYRLGELGFESFEADSGQLKAYIQASFFNETESALQWEDVKGKIRSIKSELIPECNWNAVWESQYEAVLFDKYCWIRAPFHESVEDVKWDIIIEPKMSFGTAHHPTTALMIESISEENWTGKTVLDMGCGTGVLAILAAKEGAYQVDAVDNDEWAYRNTLENAERNKVSQVKAIWGDATVLKGKIYELILANINRNILLRDMMLYAECLPFGGYLFLSGFYEQDMEAIEAECNMHRLFYVSHKHKQEWVAMKFVKK